MKQYSSNPNIVNKGEKSKQKPEGANCKTKDKTKQYQSLYQRQTEQTLQRKGIIKLNFLKMMQVCDVYERCTCFQAQQNESKREKHKRHAMQTASIKKSQLAILIPDKVDSKKRSITSDRETT